MYAVITSGGKQHKVAEGETVQVELLDAAEGAVKSLTQSYQRRGNSLWLATPETSNIIIEFTQSTES